LKSLANGRLKQDREFFMNNEDERKRLKAQRKVAIAARHTTLSFIMVENWLENRGVSEEEFSKIKDLCANSDDGILWLAHCFEDEGVNFKIGLQPIEISEYPRLNFVKITLGRNHFHDSQDSQFKPLRLDNGFREAFSFKLFVSRYIGETVDIVDFLSNTFLSCVNASYQSQENIAKQAKVRRDFSLFFKELHCNQPPFSTSNRDPLSR